MPVFRPSKSLLQSMKAWRHMAPFLGTTHHSMESGRGITSDRARDIAAEYASILERTSGLPREHRDAMSTPDREHLTKTLATLRREIRKCEKTTAPARR